MAEQRTGAQSLVDAVRLSFNQPMVPLADVNYEHRFHGPLLRQLHAVRLPVVLAGRDARGHPGGGRVGEDRVAVVHLLAEVIKSDTEISVLEVDFFDMVARALNASPAEIAGLSAD